jgi:hypothetical protein
VLHFCDGLCQRGGNIGGNDDVVHVFWCFYCKFVAKVGKKGE